MCEIKKKEKSRMAHFSNLIDWVEDKIITFPRNRRRAGSGEKMMTEVWYEKFIHV